NVTEMCGMFYYCNSLPKLDLSSFDTSNVKSMDSMFSFCNYLPTLDLSNFDTSNVKTMDGMFALCESLKTLDLSSFDTSNVTNMKSMFRECTGLTKLDLSGFDTSNVTDMSNMFNSCEKLTALDISGFNTGKVTKMNAMFYHCTALTGLDLSSITEKPGMFNECNSLNTLTLGEKFTDTDTTCLINGDGWVNAKDPKTIISGDGEYAVIENSGKNTYKRLPIKDETKPTYPTNIKVEYSEKTRQVRFKWNKVEGAEKYGIAVFMAGKWRIQKQDITDTVYTSPKGLVSGKTYKVAIAAKVNGKWDTNNAIRNAVTVTIKGSNSYVKPDREIKYGSDLYVIADEVTMYLGPDTSYGKVTTIPGETLLQELGVMNNNYNWAFTEYNGQYGWVQVFNDSGERQIQVWYPVADKPVIYLYPEKETDVHVELELTEADLSTTYPKYDNGWDVVAKPDGSLVNKADGTHHRYLFWDAVNCRTEFDFSKGFCVAGSDTESFLKEKLSYMGLTEEEMNEFIVYWLPRMEHNKYNLISFQSDKYTDTAKLNITPAPDSMLRVFMTYVPLEEAVDIEQQELSTFERSGFTVVEWGGSEI
ncbi:BspA family leucine-rich repeat surface protein, partial [uncultured Ruminococcus sp.]|uniref:BspA family leucine-rich repeat surface protein n=1 Tax=uncultured Ruminococcus sp. TaxID=165186 RepID=UPI0025CCA499